MKYDKKINVATNFSFIRWMTVLAISILNYHAFGLAWCLLKIQTSHLNYGWFIKWWCLFAEPTQIYRFLRTRNLIAVSYLDFFKGDKSQYFLYLLAQWSTFLTPFFLICPFLYSSLYSCTGHSPTCPTETQGVTPKGKIK